MLGSLLGGRIGVLFAKPQIDRRLVIACLYQVLLRSGREEQATMTSLAALVVVLMIVVQKIAALFDLVKDLFQF